MSSGRARYAYTLPEHPITHEPELELAALLADPDAQRHVNQNRAQTIANGLVPSALGTIVVSQRENGDRYVVDGLHRKRACEIVGRTTIAGEIHHGLTQQDEAVLFLIKNRESAKPNALDEYKVGLTAGLPLFVDTQSIIDKHELVMGSTSTNSIGAVAGVLRITDKYGPEVLDRVLTVAEGAWGRTPATWDGMLLGGLGQCLGKHGALIDDTVLATKLGKRRNAAGWIGTVNSVATGGGLHHSGTGSRVSTCYALFVSEWNRGRKGVNRIPVAD